MKGNNPLDDIVLANLKLVPKKLHGIYVNLINNTMIFPDAGSIRNYTKLYSLISNCLGFPVSLSNICILEHENSGVRSQFFRANSLDGRFEISIPFYTVSDLLQLTALSVCATDKRLETRNILNSLYNEIPFVILVGQAFSGTSVIGDCLALRRLMDLLGAPKKNIIAAVCRGTNVAIKSLCKVFDSVLVVERIPDSASIFSGDNEFCLSGTKGGDVRNLAKWFRSNMVPGGGLLDRMERIFNDPELGLWGFGRGGWLITTSNNTPNNSLPLLWYTPEGGTYIAPYPRVSSRLYENDVWNLRPILWDIIKKKIRATHG